MLLLEAFEVPKLFRGFAHGTLLIFAVYLRDFYISNISSEILQL